MNDILDGGFIERYHIKGQRMLTRQSVAEHSWRMAAILFDLWPGASTDLIWAVLLHDVSERVTGDMPSNVKRASPEAARVLNALTTAEEHRLGIRFDLTGEEQRMLAWLDRFEGAVHCCDELEMGNRKVIPTMLRYIEYASSPEYVLLDPDREAARQRLQRQLAQKATALINHEEPLL